MLRNPEFTRNAWVELSLKRLVSLPLLLITVYYLAYTLNEDYPVSYLPQLSILFYLAFTFLWGTRLAGETVVKEINASTWPFQIMTSMSPTKMAFGKLFGSTAYIWYGNIICMILYVLSYKINSEKLPVVSNAELLTNVAVFMLIGLLAHILPLATSLHSIRWRHFFERFEVTFYQLMGLFMLIPLYAVFLGNKKDRMVSWYGELYSMKAIAIIFSLIFIAWGIIAIINQIKTEFGQEPYPVSWFLFSISLVIVLFGLNNYSKSFMFSRYFGTISSLFSLIALSYITLSGESNMALRPHLISKYYNAKQYKRLFMIMPRSFITIPIILALVIILNFQLASQDSDSSVAFICVIWAVMLFMVRDFCFIYLWSLFAQGNEKDTTAVPVLISLSTYTVLPAIFYKLKLYAICPFFIPFFYNGDKTFTFTESAVLTIAPAATEFLIIFVLLVMGLRKKFRDLKLDEDLQSKSI
ncbi:MAG: hypothetical protein LBR70_00280 [Lactobacillaceae bacterium]|jgi:hypothetical protein|nr:hypothetical protein [Lactobacillaceae bacterium]